MKRMIPAWLALVVFLLLPAIAAAQNARVSGQVSDKDGKPWPDVSVQIKSDSGRTFTLKTDKDGKFKISGLVPGVRLSARVMRDYRLAEKVFDERTFEPGQVVDLGEVHVRAGGGE